MEPIWSSSEKKRLPEDPNFFEFGWPVPWPGSKVELLEAQRAVYECKMPSFFFSCNRCWLKLVGNRLCVWYWRLGFNLGEARNDYFRDKDKPQLQIKILAERILEPSQRKSGAVSDSNFGTCFKNATKLASWIKKPRSSKILLTFCRTTL